MPSPCPARGTCTGCPPGIRDTVSSRKSVCDSLEYRICYVFDQIRDSNAIVNQYSSMLRTSNRCAAQILLVRNTNRYTEQEGYVHPSVRIRAIEQNNFPTIQSGSARARDDSYQRFINSKPGERREETMLRLGAGDRSSATEERADRCSAVLGTCGTCNRRRGRWPTITIRLAKLTGNNTQ